MCDCLAASFVWRLHGQGLDKEVQKWGFQDHTGASQRLQTNIRYAFSFLQEFIKARWSWHRPLILALRRQRQEPQETNKKKDFIDKVSLCNSPGSPQTQRSNACLCLPSARIKGVCRLCCHHWLWGCFTLSLPVYLSLYFKILELSNIHIYGSIILQMKCSMFSFRHIFLLIAQQIALEAASGFSLQQ